MTSRQRVWLAILGAFLSAACGPGKNGPQQAEPTPPRLPPIPDPLRGLAPHIFEPPPEIEALTESSAATSEPITGPISFAKHVAPIIWKHCTPCHHDGGLAPFSFTSYELVKKRANQIVEVTSSRYMPPWQPARGYNQFHGERGLTAAQIETLRAWVEAGSPAGNLAALPPVPKYTRGWRLGKPDRELRFPAAYPLRAENPDVFRNLVIPDVSDRQRYVKGVEFLTNGPPVIHHVEIRIDETERSLELDRADLEPGFGGMDFDTAHYPEGHFLNWVPGKTPAFEPDGRAWVLGRGDDLVVQLHMLPSGKPEVVDPVIGLYYSDTPPSDLAPLNLGLQVKQIDIPAGVRDYVVKDAYRLPVEVDLISVMPHAHYVCRDMKAYAVLPDGRKQWLARIKDWDLSWQDDYRLIDPITLPAGTVVVMIYTFDNSADNPRNPFNPPQRIVYGPNSSEEMADLWVRVLPKGALDRRNLKRDNGLHRALIDLAKVAAEAQRNPSAANHQRVARQYERLGELRPAIQHHREAVRLAPSDGDAIELLAGALQQAGEKREALELLERAAELDPRDAVLRYNIAVIHASEGRAEPAITQLRQAVAIRADYAKARGALARLLLEAGDLDEALSQLQAGHRAAPDDPLIASQLSLLLALHPDPAQRDPSQALALAQRAVDAGSARDPIALRSLAAALAAAGKLQQASERAQQSYQLAYGTELGVIVERELQAYRAGRLPEPFTRKSR